MENPIKSYSLPDRGSHLKRCILDRDMKTGVSMDSLDTPALRPCMVLMGTQKEEKTQQEEKNKKTYSRLLRIRNLRCQTSGISEQLFFPGCSQIIKHLFLD
jgi:hypothetical protein